MSKKERCKLKMIILTRLLKMSRKLSIRYSDLSTNSSNCEFHPYVSKTEYKSSEDIFHLRYYTQLKFIQVMIKMQCLRQIGGGGTFLFHPPPQSLSKLHLRKQYHDVYKSKVSYVQCKSDTLVLS